MSKSMPPENVQERMERWLAKTAPLPLAKREADLALLLASDPGAWERHGLRIQRENLPNPACIECAVA